MSDIFLDLGHNQRPMILEPYNLKNSHIDEEVNNQLSGQLNEYSEQTFYLNSDSYSEDFHPQTSKSNLDNLVNYPGSKDMNNGVDHQYEYSSEFFDGNRRGNGQYSFGGFQYTSEPIYPLDLSAKFYSSPHDVSDDISVRRLKDICNQNSDLLHTEISSEGNAEQAYSNYGHSMGILNDNEGTNWNNYEFNQFDDFLQDDVSQRLHGSSSDQSISQQTILMSQSSSGRNNSHHHFLGPHQTAIHVNPAIIDGFGLPEKLINLSGLGAMGCHKAIDHNSELSCSSQKKAPRQAGLPTNIIPTAKMDRKTLKRLRNRVSASRCRVKKKNWIKDMEEASDALALENRKLVEKISALEHAIHQCHNLLNMRGSESPRSGLTQNHLSSSTLVMDSKDTIAEYEKSNDEGPKPPQPKVTKKSVRKSNLL